MSLSTSANSTSQLSNFTEQFYANQPIVTAVGVLSCLEFAVHIPSILVTLLFARLVCSTAILHRNLKAVLLAQASFVLCFASFRLISLPPQFSTAAPVEVSVPPVWLFCTEYFFIVFGNLVGHVLMLERILATVWVERYESYRKWHFTILWTVSVISLSAVNTYFYAMFAFGIEGAVSDVNLYTFAVAMLASFAEIFIIALLNVKNADKFKRRDSAIRESLHTLSIRYQLMENIRTGRQLAPTFLCHFFGIAISFLVTVYFKFATNDSIPATFLVGELAIFLQALNNLSMVTTAIVFHPQLNHNARRVFRQMANLVGLKRCSNAINPVELEVCTLPTDCNGNILLVGATAVNSKTKEQDQHFSDLRKMWGDA